MENAQIIQILNITFLEVQGQAEFLSKKVQCIESFCLCFCDWRDAWSPWNIQEPCKVTKSILGYDPLWRVECCWCMIE